jgi:hypothetical protein
MHAHTHSSSDGTGRRGLIRLLCVVVAVGGGGGGALLLRTSAFTRETSPCPATVASACTPSRSGRSTQGRTAPVRKTAVIEAPCSPYTRQILSAVWTPTVPQSPPFVTGPKFQAAQAAREGASSSAASGSAPCVIVGGHSLWFRSFFREFLPQSASEGYCKKVRAATDSAMQCRAPGFFSGRGTS